MMLKIGPSLNARNQADNLGRLVSHLVSGTSVVHALGYHRKRARNKNQGVAQISLNLVASLVGHAGLAVSSSIHGDIAARVNGGTA